MATSSIHIEAGASGYFAHNSRESKTVNSIFDDEKNFCSCTNAQAFETYKNELAKRTEAYKENFGRTKLHAKTITHLSAIVNFNKEHSPKDIKKICDYLENKFDTKVIQYAMHRDEGHISENGEKIKNYHAHIEFMGLDSKGNSVRRKLDKKALIELQSDVANILEMQRGKNYTELKEKRPKRLDTYEFKKVKENESKLILASKEQLKEANNQLRAYMKDNGAGRQDYAELEKEKKILEEQLKAKELTQENLLKKFKEIQDKFIKEKEHLKSIVEVKEIDIIDLQNENKALKTQKEVLNDKLVEFQEKINSSSNMSDLELKNELQKIINEEIEVKDVKNGLFSSEKAPVIKNQKSFFKKIQDLAIQGTQKLKDEFQILKNKYNDLSKDFSFLVKENAELKAKVRKLENEAFKQKENNLNNPLDEIKKEMKLVQKQPLKKRDFGRSR